MRENFFNYKYIGEQVGAFVGEIVGSMVGCFIGSAIYNSVFYKAHERNISINKLRKYQKTLERIVRQLEKYRLELQKNIQLANLELDFQI